MGLGTILRVGFDALQVRAGLAGLSRMFGGAMRGFRQVGIGAARQVGAGMTDLIGRALMAIPDGMREMMDWAGDLTDQSAQTGVAVSKLVLLEEALRLAGASARDTSMMISRLATNLNDARDEAGPAREALNKLGFLAEDFADLPIDKAFEKIGKRAATLPKDFRGLENIMSDLFGARMGFKLIRFFRDFDGGMATAEKNVGTFARRLDTTAGGYDNMSDSLGRFQMRWRETMSVIADGMTSLFGDDWIDKFFDWMNPERIRNTIRFLFEELRGMMNGGGGGMGKIFSGMGNQIGEGFKESMKGTRFGRFMFSSGGGGAEEKQPPLEIERLWSQGETQTGLLRQIATKYTGWQ